MKYKIENTIEALIFDCDGTLVETIPSHLKAWEKVFSKYNIPLPLSYFDKFNSYPSWMIVQEITKDTGIALDPYRIAEEKEDLLFENMGSVIPIEPVLDYVKAYHGKLPMVVISGGIRKNVIKSLEEIGFASYFDMIIGADDDHPPKTSPDAFSSLAKRLGVLPVSCVVFEDGDIGLESAKRAGMYTVDVRIDL